MADLAEKIAKLEARIVKYEAEWDASTAPEERTMYVRLITTSRETLNRLLDQQKAQTTGKRISYLFVC